MHPFLLVALAAPVVVLLADAPSDAFDPTLALSPATLIASAIAGILGPTITAVINRPSWSSATRGQIATLVSILLSVIALAVTRGFGDSWYAAIMGTIGLSQFLYQTVFRATGLLSRLELATSPKELQTVANVVTGETVALQVPADVDADAKAEPGALLPPDAGTRSQGNSGPQWVEPDEEPHAVPGFGQSARHAAGDALPGPRDGASDSG